MRRFGTKSEIVSLHKVDSRDETPEKKKKKKKKKTISPSRERTKLKKKRKFNSRILSQLFIRKIIW